MGPVCAPHEAAVWFTMLARHVNVVIAT